LILLFALVLKLSLLNLFDILAEAIAIALMASEGIVFIFISISGIEHFLSPLGYLEEYL